MSKVRDFSRFAEPFERDGVTLVDALFTEAEMRLIEQGCEYKASNPDAGSQALYHGVHFSLSNSLHHPAFDRLIHQSAMADLVQALWRGADVWYENEQLWQKQGGAKGARRTAWHQDASYDPFAGSRTVVLWVPLTCRSSDTVLEVVRGSHRGPVYNGPRFDPADDQAPTYEDPEIPLTPDIESNRAAWDIFSTCMARGDALVFHHRSLHGGAAVPPGFVSRTISFRFIGDDVLFTPPPRRVQSEGTLYREKRLAPGLDGLVPGEPIHHSPYFRKVRPWSEHP